MSDEDRKPPTAEEKASAVRFAIFWFGLPLALFIILAYFTRS